MMPQLVKETKSQKANLGNLLLAFTKDGNRIVKVAAFKIIPEFLANYESHEVPMKLFEIYLSLLDHQINDSVSHEN